MLKKFLATIFVTVASPVWAQQAFQPVVDSTIAVAASTSNANGTFLNPPNGAFQARIYNACATTAFVRFGGTSTTSNIPIPAGVVEVLTVPNGVTTVGVILASGSGCNVYFSTGGGI